MSALPGLAGGLALAAGAPLPLALFDSNNSAAETIAAPAGIEAGDLIVLVDRAVGSGSFPLNVTPSGFTSIDQALGNGFRRQNVSYRIADGTETTITGMNGASGNGKALAVFRGNPPIQSVTVSTPNSTATDGDPGAQSVLASAGTAPLIVFGCYGSGGTIDPRAFTPAKDGEESPSGGLYLAWRIDNGAGQDTTVDMEDEGTGNILQSFYIECADA